MTPGDAVPIQKMVAEVVSVVIPTYNAEPYIVGTLFSVLRQRHPGLVKVEILVVDDNSTDGTLSAVETIAASYPGEIRVIRQQRNCGPAVARNRGLRDATGDFICFLDADDQYVPGFFAFCVEVLHRQPDAAAIVTGVELVNCHRPVDPVLYEALVAKHSIQCITAHLSRAFARRLSGSRLLSGREWLAGYRF